MNNATDAPKLEALEAYCNASVKVGQMTRTQRRDILTLAGIDPDEGGDDE